MKLTNNFKICDYFAYYALKQVKMYGQVKQCLLEKIRFKWNHRLNNFIISPPTCKHCRRGIWFHWDWPLCPYRVRNGCLCSPISSQTHHTEQLGSQRYASLQDLQINVLFKYWKIILFVIGDCFWHHCCESIYKFDYCIIYE